MPKTTMKFVNGIGPENRRRDTLLFFVRRLAGMTNGKIVELGRVP